MNNFDAFVFQILESKKVKSKDKKESPKKGFIDSKKSDLNKDGKLSEYEQKRGEAIAQAVANKKKK